MRDALYQHQLVANPLQVKAARLHALEARLQNENMGGMLFTNEADVQLLLSCLQSAAHSQEMLQILKSSQEPEPKANVGGNLTVAVVNAQDGQQSFWVSIDDGNRKHVLERVEPVSYTHLIIVLACIYYVEKIKPTFVLIQVHKRERLHIFLVGFANIWVSCIGLYQRDLSIPHLKVCLLYTSRCV